MLTVLEVTEEINSRIAGYLVIVRDALGNENAIAIPSCMAWACRGLGVSVANLHFATDAELATIQVDLVDAFLDLVELRALESIRTNLTKVTATVGSPATGINTSHSWSHLFDQINKIIKEKKQALQAGYGWALGNLLATDIRRMARIESL